MAAVKRLIDQIQPIRYELVTDVDLAGFRYKTTEIIRFKLKRRTKVLTWHASELTISAATLGDESLVPTYDDVTQTVRLTSPIELAAGEHVLELEFNGEIQDSLHGFYRSSYLDNGVQTWLAVTQFEAIHAREAFVCIDEPAAKAVFELSITADEGLTVLANTAVVREHVLESGRRRFDFAPTPAMSTYLLAYVVGNLAHVETATTSGVKVRAWATPGNVDQLQFALDVGKRSLEFYEEYFALPYPLSKLDMVAVPDFAAGAMENWGCVTYRETDLLIDDRHSSLANRQRVAMVVAHELAHQWFGNLVTMAWWNDLWLNESFASWAETMTLDHLFPEWEMWDDFVVTLGAYARDLDSLANTHAIEVDVPDPAGIDEIFDAISYWKGQSVLRMLEGSIGVVAMRDGLRAYLTTHAYKNATTRDLWAALGKASKQPVAQIMSGWTGEPGYPVVAARAEASGVHLTQSRFYASMAEALAASPAPLWTIPLTLTGASGDDHTLMTGRELVLAGDGGWLKLNTRQTGFYRVHYDGVLLERLQAQLTSLPAIDRYGLVDDQFALAGAGLNSANQVLALLSSVREVIDYPTWTAVLDGLSALTTLFEPDDAVRLKLEAFGSWLISPMVERLGWEAGQDEAPSTTLLRQSLLGAAAHWGNATVIAEALKHFAERSVRPIPVDLEAVAYGVVVRTGDVADYTTVLELYRQTTQPQAQSRLRGALAQTEQPELIEQTLRWALSDEVRPQDSLMVIGRVMQSRRGSDAAWQFVRDEWPELLRRYGAGGHMLERLPEFAGNAFASEVRATEVEAFFLIDQPSGATARPTRQAAENIRRKAAWRERDVDAITAWLDALPQNG